MLDALDEFSVLLIQDWAMKFLPRKYRESQSDWLGKRVLSWHITVVTRRQSPDRGFEMMTFAHVLQSGSQDSLSQRKPHKFAYLTMKNSLRREMTCFAVVWTT